MIVDSEIINELRNSAGENKIRKAEEYIKDKKINITKVIYENPRNFEIRSKVKGNYDNYNIYIKVTQGEIENVTCSCPDYYEHYATCKHILATILEFDKNESYVRIFSGDNKSKQSNMEIYQKFSNHDEKYRIYKQLINSFYNIENKTNSKNIRLYNVVKIQPKILYNSYNKTLKMEIEIGDKQLYKIKSISEFYERIINEEQYKYGVKLDFIHNEEAFRKEDIPLLKYILKYAEIIKYANDTMGNYSHYGRTIADNYITISNNGIDELFDIMNGKEILFQRENILKNIKFIDREPNIEFNIEESENSNYKITTNIDVYGYEIIEGKDNIYMLLEDSLYKCSKEFKQNILKILQIYRTNFISDIDVRKKDLVELFSVVFPKVKNNIKTEKLDEEIVKKYIPQDLCVKIFMDYDQKNRIVADIKFVYGEIEFNPLIANTPDIPRDLSKENEIIDTFINTGFMLDTKNERLILADDNKIYDFLTYEIEKYMKEFEVLVTENFKQKEIKQPKASGLGVRVENNLLEIDFTNINFQMSELKDIMEKYNLKKKYHRLKDGSFINLESNEAIEFINNITQGLDIDYKKIEAGTIKLPIYRTMYLDKLLSNTPSINVVKNEEYKNIVNKITQNDITEETKFPKGLNVSLREYQKIGFEWLKVLDEYKFGGILADDMGLGKTLQLIAIIMSYIENEKNLKPSIVICPSSLSLNWQNEIKKFAPKLKSLVIRGNSNERKNQIKNIPDYNVVITSYDLLKRDIELYKEQKYEFKYIIADEAQYIKNNNTQNAKVIKEINSETRFALTGTPIENSLSELWSIFDFIMPGYLYSYKKFKELFEIPIIKEQDEEAIKKLRMLIQPFILRRIKKEVLTELPDKTMMVLNNEMQEEQQKIYMSYMELARKQAIEEINIRGLEKSQIKILSLLMRLRQICCHPSLFINNYKGESSKLNQCTEILKDAVDSGHKILLFSSYTSMFDIIEKELKKQNIKYFKLTGQTKVSERIKLVDEFNENDDIKVFLISLKAGGTGLNLIGADVVIHYDPWWNISAENQATDRTYRIGQKKNVQVYKLITKNSIEEKIYELQEKKSKLVDDMLSTKQTFINKLSKEDILELFK